MVLAHFAIECSYTYNVLLIFYRSEANFIFCYLEEMERRHVFHLAGTNNHNLLTGLLHAHLGKPDVVSAETYANLSK